MSFPEVFVVFVIIIALIMFVQKQYVEVESVQSVVDKRSYIVRRLPDSRAAADYLAEINIGLERLVKHMISRYSDNMEVVQLYQNYNPGSISEGSAESGYTSYSVNKGEKLILCIRQTDNKFVKKNVVMYVAIHELAHIMTKEVGHTPRFWENFKLLLENAIELGIYTKENYNNRPEDYCGIKITSTILNNQ
jgi:predicted metal-dependent hydrolase